MYDDRRILFLASLVFRSSFCVRLPSLLHVAMGMELTRLDQPSAARRVAHSTRRTSLSYSHTGTRLVCRIAEHAMSASGGSTGDAATTPPAASTSPTAAAAAPIAATQPIPIPATSTPATTNTHTTKTHVSLAESVGYQGYLRADPIPPPTQSSSSSSSAASLPTSSSTSSSSSSAAASDPSTLPVDALVPYPEGSTPPARQYARTALKAVGHRAQTLAQASKVVQFGVNTTAAVARTFIPHAARQFTFNKWEAYGDPLLSKIDQRIDEAFQAVEGSRVLGSTGGSAEAHNHAAPNAHTNDTSSVTSEVASDSSTDEMKDSASSGGDMAMTVHDPHDEMIYAMYWQQLKGKFVESRWYSMVDEILLQNRVVEAFSARMMRPAETFFTTITEEFLTHATLEEFMAALKIRVGPAWSDTRTNTRATHEPTRGAIQA